MKKVKEKPNIKLIIIMGLGLIILALSSILFYQYKKANTSFLESVTILGNEFKLTPGVYVYEFTVDNPKLKEVSNGCELPYTYKVADMFEKKTDGESGIHYFVDGETYADFSLNFTKKNSDKVLAKYYFYITFNKPLEIAESCR